MPTTLVKYFLKRWGFQLLMGFAFFGGLLLAWEIKSISTIIFKNNASIHNLIPLLLTTIPWNVGLILPMAAVLGGLMGTQHLSEGSEFVALQGLGCDKRGFLIPWGVLSAILMICSVINAHWISPWSGRMEQGFFYNLAQEAVLSGGYMPKGGEEPKKLLGDNTFLGNNDDTGNNATAGHTFYWGIPKKDDKLHIMQIDPEHVSHLVSSNYKYNLERVKTNSHDSFDYMQLRFRFEDVTGKTVSRVLDSSAQMGDLSYKTFEINQPVQIKKQSVYQPTVVRHLNTGELLKLSKSDDMTIRGTAGVELSRRFSNPLTCCALLLLGISIGLSHPRFYKGGAFIKSIVLILLYFVVVKAVEGWIENDKINWTYVSFALPFSFFLAGLVVLDNKMHPGRHGRHKKFISLFGFFRKLSPAKIFARLRVKHIIHNFWSTNSNIVALRKRHRDRSEKNIIGRWTSKKWWANFIGVIAVFMIFHVFMEFAALAHHVATGDGRLLLFIKYWVCNLPVTLPFVLPVVFLLACVLTFSDASISREWVALRAGGISLVQWGRSSWKAWCFAILAAFVIDAYLSPKAFAIQDYYYKQIKRRDVHQEKVEPAPLIPKTPTTLFVGSTSIFWYSEGDVRWGFPLLPTTEAPSLIRWEHGKPFTQQLDWDSNRWTKGLDAETLFPESSLRRYQKAEEIPTLDLFTWEALTPSADRGTLLWGRLLKWLVGPCLLFAALGFAFPAPRKGRGQVLGYALLLSLVFMFIQNLFEGASKAGQIPPLWGVLAPMLILIGFGLINLQRLRT